MCMELTYYNLLVVLLLQFCTPLDLAHDHNHSQVVEYLLSKGAKVKNCSKVSMHTVTFQLFLQVRSVFCRCERFNVIYLCVYLMYIILQRHLLYVCHIVIIYCTHCSMTLRGCLMLLVMVDWRMFRNMSRMEWMSMGVVWQASSYIQPVYFYISSMFFIIKQMYLMLQLQ